MGTIEAAVALSLAATSSVALAQPPSGGAVPVTVDNYNRAQSDVYFGLAVKTGHFGKFVHRRELVPVDNKQGIIRPNRDTLYSLAVFDLDAGPVTVTLPDAGKRFMSMQVLNEDQYTPAVYYGAGRHTLTKEGIGTRYVLVVVRALVDPANPQDVQQVHALQDALEVSQRGPGTFQIPNWDEASLKKVHAALLQLGETISDTRRMFGANKDQVDPVRHLVGTALVWGGLPEKDALCLEPALKAKVDALGIIGGGAAPKGVADMSLYRRLAALGLTGPDASRNWFRSYPARSASNASSSRYSPH